MFKAESLSEAIDLAKQGRQSMVKCEAHEDGEASLHVSPGQSQPVVMRCHAGCTNEEVLEAAGIDYSELLAPRDETKIGTDEDMWTPAGPASHRYEYVDEEGTLLFEVLRIPQPGGKKTFRQRTPDPTQKSGWRWNMEGTRRVLYRLPEVLKAKDEGQHIWVVEGEKDVETLRAIGEVATTSPMGANKWQDEYAYMLSGATVTVVADKDNTGREHARVVKESLVSLGCSVGIKEAAGKHKDVTDHLSAGLTLDQLLETSPDDSGRKEEYAVDILDAVQRTFDEKQFVIPGTLAEGDRWMITGLEGHGKSTLMRQIAVQVAAGLHPFTLRKIPPKRVLYLDAENHPNQVLESWQQLVGLCARHNAPLEPNQLHIMEQWDTPPDLTSESGTAWLIERIHAYKPDLLCVGPVYNITSKDVKDDETVRKLKTVINDVRGLYGTAVIMEHHAPHKGNNDTKRSTRPYGSSMILRWPEFGYGMTPTEEKGVYEWEPWRGARIRSREFPEFLRWGKPNTDEFPWTTCSQDEAGNYH